MANLCVILLHSTDAPERAVAGVGAAGAAVAAGRVAALYLAVEGVRLAARGVAETLSNADGRPDVRKALDDFLARGGRLLVSSPCWAARGYEASALLPGASMAAEDGLAALAAEGFSFASF